jgi:hypothetical protein
MMRLLTRPAELSVARWITGSSTPFDQLVTFGPDVFDASARLRFIPDPAAPGQEEADVELPEDHLPDLVQAQIALHRLAAFTATPDVCYFCFWEGYPYVDLPKPRSDSMMVLPHRRYVLFSGPLQSIDSVAEDFGSGTPVDPPAFVWPADHRWCFACDVDPHWAGVGAERAAVQALVAHDGLDVVRAEPADPQPLYY